MKTAATVALAVVGTVAVAGVGYGGYQALNDEGPYAEVVKVERSHLHVPRQRADRRARHLNRRSSVGVDCPL